MAEIHNDWWRVDMLKNLYNDNLKKSLNSDSYHSSWSLAASVLDQHLIGVWCNCVRFSMSLVSNICEIGKLYNVFERFVTCSSIGYLAHSSTKFILMRSLKPKQEKKPKKSMHFAQGLERWQAECHTNFQIYCSSYNYVYIWLI